MINLKSLGIGLILMISFTLSSQELLIFGGKNHDIFLGCLNCTKYDQKSIWNQYGDFGNKYNSNCIWNQYGDYGNKYSDTSPLNSYASYPPVLVDSDGNFYGYFTANKYKDKATSSKLAFLIIDNYEAIIDDVGDAYDKIFN